MKIENAFDGVNSVFLDTAPVIYYLEQNPHYLAIANRIFDDLIENGIVSAVGSPVTVAECFRGKSFRAAKTFASEVAPIRDGLVQRQQDFVNFLLENSNISRW